jgi:hypothetical protein
MVAEAEVGRVVDGAVVGLGNVDFVVVAVGGEVLVVSIVVLAVGLRV